MQKTFLSVAAVLGALSVALGAFAAHKLREIAAPDAVAVFETGVRYQFYHVFALLFAGLLSERVSNRWIIWAGNCFIMGIVFFCGSLYTLTALRTADISPMKLIYFATPVGGVFFIAGWVFLWLSIIRSDKK
ncbi:MAG TPA: DUF423 domain-containing protein [Puia sp.]|nr:DUF423 domain-containing protein [Puia sp.]